MSRELRVLFIVWAIAVMAVFLIGKASVSADASNSYTITATVLPVKVIFIDSDNKIVKIEANSTEQITPEVYTAALPHKAQAFDSVVQSEYSYIEANCYMPLKTGIIYDGQCLKAGEANIKTISSLTERKSSFASYTDLLKDISFSFLHY